MGGASIAPPASTVIATNASYRAAAASRNASSLYAAPETCHRKGACRSTAGTRRSARPEAMDALSDTRAGACEPRPLGEEGSAACAKPTPAAG